MHAGARLAIFFFLRMESMQWCVCGVVEHHDVKEKAKIFVRCDLSHVSYLFPCFSGFPPQFCHIFIVFVTCFVCKTHDGFCLACRVCGARCRVPWLRCGWSLAPLTTATGAFYAEKNK